LRNNSASFGTVFDVYGEFRAFGLPVIMVEKDMRDPSETVFILERDDFKNDM